MTTAALEPAERRDAGRASPTSASTPPRGPGSTTSRATCPRCSWARSIRAAGIGEIVATRCDAYAVGDVVTTLAGLPGVRDRPRRRRLHAGHRAWTSSTIPRCCRSTDRPGATAYFGMHDVVRPKAGETVVGLAAAGRDRLARRPVRQDRRRPRRRHRRRSGASAGWSVEDFGFDACIDYRERRPGRGR